MNTNVAKADRKANIPDCLYWSCEEVADWIEELGFSKYRDCFLNNFIDGKKLITVTSSALPNMGVSDFTHIKIITAAVRELLDIPLEDSLEFSCYRNPRLLYLQLKSKTGYTYDHMTYNAFKIQNARFLKP
ncbi:hypothetical protein LOTGIDRAFT_236529 [Lottia gigantea]|uniref:SAM domain-containing protein n=1 Tax=Lottia gigantea TaxID=225164 RepID=V4B4Y0_LOTGI|nr:hypothetical protein LOTGIDRAFT_236529 [Lottia gigantea]ESO83494.1 hypothetical protein LOTGIDRAFT_236529 [Lottia gigantea]